jgi:hypothetical protein
MKTTLQALFIGLGLLSAAGAANAQSYSIDWYKVAGGGGTSSNGQYAITGTIGQHDAGGPLTGGNFSHTGGFWSLVAVQTPGSPLLTIVRTSSSTVTVSWPLSAAGFRLQQNINLGTTNWTTPGETITNNGTNNFIIVNLPAANRYFRLVNP